ncbi:Z1 domain-containing protein [Empedobacter falsenii]
MENINLIYITKIRPELEAYGSALREEDINETIDSLDNQIKIRRDIFEINDEIKYHLKDLAKKQFGFIDADHIYIKGQGIYNDSEEIELDKENWHYYKRHRNYLNDIVYTDNESIVNSLDYETDQIIKKFPKPNDLETFSKKGLVIGYVQSGKTANFTHLISKAASIGYRFVIVLAGMTDTLRLQTQFRLDKELIGVNGSAIPNLKTIKWLKGEDKFIPLTHLPDKNVKKDNGDFVPPVKNFSDHFNNTTDVTIAVIKKLARNSPDRFLSVIGNLINWINNAYDKDTIKSVPVLIIDDEADQASIDANDVDADPTVINHAIRQLISLFPKSVYVGYTATPFANVFINPSNDYLGLEDLYPKDFIYALPEPDNYFGSNKFFSIKNSKDELALINLVPNNEKSIINDAEQDITENLKLAIIDFIHASIIRKYRNNDEYCGMMIHTDHRNDNHNVVFSKVKLFIEKYKCSDNDYVCFQEYISKSKIKGRLQGINNEYPDYSFSEYKNEFDYILSKLNGTKIVEHTKGSGKNKKIQKVEKTSNIRVINSREDKLDYPNEDLQYLICIGGNIMSRGVTIEGLTVTYYLRDTLKYDTLLQMGRWFGFRTGYEDLLSIYTTARIAEHFEFVMGVEDDLRNEVTRYIEEGLTPLDFAPKVRAHTRMVPSAKMGNSEITKSFAQKTVQTIYFDRDIDILKNNFNLGKELIQNHIHLLKPEETYPHKIKGTINNVQLLLDFIDQYQLTKYNSFDKEAIKEYIDFRIKSAEIKDFNLIISSLKSLNKEAETTKISTLTINPVKRNIRLSKGREFLHENIVNLGVISDTSDVEIAIKSEKLNIILYFIDRVNSDAFNSEHKTNLYNPNLLDFNPIGYAIVFPKTKIANGEFDYHQQIFN